jgi:hypothetical protein
MPAGDELHILITTSPASDSWGFVGVVSVGDFEAYRTIRAFASPGEALSTAQQALAGVLGSLMAGQEWRMAQDDFGHAPRRAELEFGLGARHGRTPADEEAALQKVTEPRP